MEQDSAFEALFHAHWGRVHALLRRMLGDSQEAEDVALEVFMRLHGSTPRMGADQNVEGWLMRVTTRLGLNALRARTRRRRHEEHAGREHGGDGTPLHDGRAAADAEAERAAVRQALAAMKPRDAELLLLRHAGLSYAELARALDLAPSSIGTLLVRAERAFEAGFRKLEET